jgi:hypothetical protein
VDEKGKSHRWLMLVQDLDNALRGNQSNQDIFFLKHLSAAILFDLREVI